MTAKCFEIRDKATFFPAIAVKLDAANEAEQYLIRRAGFGPDQHSFVYFLHMEDTQVSYDPFHWAGNRSRRVAHDYIAKHFDELETGQVICVETIIGERETPKTSERLSYPFA